MNKNHLKKLISAAVLGMVVLTGCGVNDAAPQEETAEPLRVGMLRVDDSFPFYVAEKEGLFEKHNVNVELKEFSNARDQSTALQGGELDVLMTDPVDPVKDIGFLRGSGDGIDIIAGMFYFCFPQDAYKSSCHTQSIGSCDYRKYIFKLRVDQLIRQ